MRVGLPCRENDPDLWFAGNDADMRYAQQLCTDCPLRRPCLAGAIERQEPWGVWGGYIVRDGVVIAQRPSRGRRPKRIEVAA